MNIIEKLKSQISELYKQVETIQAQCSHPKEAVTKKHSADTGNYDPSADRYWTDFTCDLCQKHWTEEGSK